MKRFLSMAVAAFILTLSASAALSGPQDFTLVNGSGSNICYVYISASNNENWDSDVLGAEECMAPGESMAVSFNAGDQPMWDLRVEDENGNYEDYRGFNLNEISTITINGGGQATHD